MPADTLNRDTVHALMDALGIDGYADLARRSGIERTYLSRIMRSERPAKPSHVISIASACKVPPIAITGPGTDPAAAEAMGAAS